MDRSTVTDRVAEEQSARLQKAVRDRDDQARIDWDKLLELAFDRPGSLVSIARSQAPEVSARVWREPKSGG